MGRRENKIEKYLCEQATLRNAVVRKVTYQGRRGAPDRWLFFPDGMLLIVECKAFGETPDPLQLHEMKVLRKHGYAVAWVDSRVAARKLLDDFPVLPPDVFNKEWPLDEF